jgi:branched-subunit amino acid transport protein
VSLQTAWAAVLATAAACYLLKLAGLLVPERWLEGDRTTRVLALLPVALLAALCAVQTFESSERLVLDARVLGVAAGGVTLLLRAPFIVVVATAAVVAALVRLAAG